MAELAEDLPVPGARAGDVTPARARTRLAVPGELLADLLAALAGARTCADVAGACLPLLGRRPGVRAAAVVRRCDRAVVVLASTGYGCTTMGPGAALPLDAGLPVTEAVRTGRTVVQGGGPAWVAVPFGGGLDRPGALLLSLECAPPEGTADLSRLHRLARALGQALQRADGADQAEARLAVVTAALSAPAVPGKDVVTRCAPADGEVGGDVVLCEPDGRGGRWLLVADVVGTGLVAGLLARSVRAAARAAAAHVTGPAALLGAVEHAVADDVPPGSFVTAVAVHVGAGGAVTSASAGHPAPVAVVDGRAAALEVEPGPPLAVEAGAGAPREELRTSLPAGATLLLYTDGLVERRAAGCVRMLDVVPLAQGLPDDLDAAADRLLAAADAVGPVQDDVSLLLLRLA